jgi:hypothetical protein
MRLPEKPDYAAVAAIEWIGTSDQDGFEISAPSRQAPASV